jgi:hypothetical protein
MVARDQKSALETSYIPFLGGRCYGRDVFQQKNVSGYMLSFDKKDDICTHLSIVKVSWLAQCVCVYFKTVLHKQKQTKLKIGELGN